MLIGNNATNTFLIPIASKAQYDAIVKLVDAATGIACRETVTWKGQNYVVVTADEVLSVFEVIVDHLDFLEMHHCWNVNDIVENKEAKHVDGHHKFDLLGATELDVSKLP